MSKTNAITFRFARGAKASLLKARLRACQTIKRKLGRDWVYAVPEFMDIAEKLLMTPELATASNNIIWQTGRNTVWRTEVSGEKGVFDIVYKSRPGRYRINRCISPSAMVRDAINLLAINSLGFRTTELHAVGENRTLTHWQYAFIVTRFADGFKEVTQILPGEPYADHPWIKDAVIEASLKALAKLHTLGIYHKEFKHFNIMWKESDDNSIELCLFDFETSRTIWFESFEKYMVRDLFDFFRPLELSEKALLHWIAVYLNANTSCLASSEAVFSRVMHLFKEKGV